MAGSACARRLGDGYELSLEERPWSGPGSVSLFLSADDDYKHKAYHHPTTTTFTTAIPRRGDSGSAQRGQINPTLADLKSGDTLLFPTNETF
jgi:hypothetical protein